jgi:hypothetical protein
MLRRYELVVGVVDGRIRSIVQPMLNDLLAQMEPVRGGAGIVPLLHVVVL